MNQAHTRDSFSHFGLSLLFKVFIACTILYPAYIPLNNNTYYIQAVLPNIIILFLIGWFVLFCPQQLNHTVTVGALPEGRKKNPRPFVILFAIILVLYNIICYYFNGLQNQWYWDQIHYSIGFIFFIFLLLCIRQQDSDQMNLFPFMVIVTLLSSFCCFFMFHQGLQSLNIRWESVSRNLQDITGLGLRCSWLYPHKSQYALIIVMSYFAVIQHRKRFPHPWMFWAVMIVLTYALYICDTMAAFGSVLAGIAGLFTDYLSRKKFHINKFMVIGFCVIAVAAVAVFLWINQERDLTTLGSRLGIWKGSLQVISENPTGVGFRFGTVPIPVDWYTTDNCHNVFLNHALRYSIPAGILFTLLILLIMAYTIWTSRSFFAVGTWLGIMIILNMDYSLIPVQFPHFILLIYLIYIYKPPAEQTAGGISPAP